MSQSVLYVKSNLIKKRNKENTDLDKKNISTDIQKIDFQDINMESFIQLDPSLLSHPFLLEDNILSSPLIIQKHDFTHKIMDPDFQKRDNIVLLDDIKMNINNNIIQEQTDIYLKWEKKWTYPPNFLIQILKKYKHKCIWMVVDYEDLDNLNQRWIFWSNELGWSWLLKSPKSLNKKNMTFYQEKTGIFAKFWFTSLHSEQWVWPFCNLFARQCVEHYALLTLNDICIPPYSRQMEMWTELERNTYKNVEFLLGGEKMMKMLYTYIQKK